MGVVAVAFLCMLEMDYGETFRIVNIILAAVFFRDGGLCVHIHNLCGLGRGGSVR